ncbi:Tetratricopeptide repeat-like superfamily protein, putative [Theobroma cacao]|uniref:Tetratricopeptide repeat-like superfamily protein, putative n=1 Tax=Theobroma cacao TaxID=3641 RepID=A0A061FWK3_THECC|nr:Tetratricopeptide repeat-like superfamily protein, putative [Theobroma cacao]
MLVEGVIPANLVNSRILQQSIISLLQKYRTIKKITQIHTQIIINGFSQKNFILVNLISFYITSSNNLPHALKIFETIEKPSTTIWNRVIRGYSRTENPEKSVELYNQMVATGAIPDGFTYSYLLSACARSGMLREGEQVHGKVLADGYCSNVFVRTNLVNLYAMVGGGDGIGYARRVFDEMGERNVVSWNSLLAGYIRYGDVHMARRVFDEMPERNVVSWTTMVAGFSRNGKCRQALSFFNQMRRARVQLDQVALLAALSACAELGDLESGKWIHSHIKETSRVRSQRLLVSLNNALIHMYASCGLIEEAYQVLKYMPERSTVSWTSMIMGLAKQGFAQEALVVYECMLSLGDREVKPDALTYLGVLCACSHAGYVEEGWHHFTQMTQNWGIEPRIEHYCCMIDLLSRAGFLDEAFNLIETMPVKPNDAVWGALLSGCRIHKNVDLASQVAQKLVAELDPDYAAGYLVLLSNVYAFAKRWQDVANVRQKMIDMGVKKPAGRSWVQIDGVVHDFMAGDSADKHAYSIYDMLWQVTRQAKQEGYEPDISEVLY